MDAVKSGVQYKVTFTFNDGYWKRLDNGLQKYIILPNTTMTKVEKMGDNEVLTLPHLSIMKSPISQNLSLSVTMCVAANTRFDEIVEMLLEIVSEINDEKMWEDK